MSPIPLDETLQSLHMFHAKTINNATDQRGQFSEQRPGAKIILDDSYLLQIVPYIHNNPVKAGMVTEPSDYPWSSDGLYRNEAWNGPEIDSWEYPPYFKGENRTQVYKERIGEPAGEFPGGEEYIGTQDEWESLERRKKSRTGSQYRERRGRRTKDEIAKECAMQQGVTVEAMKQPGRTEPELTARQETMVLAPRRLVVISTDAKERCGMQWRP
ncbi:MAG: transposase [bacterium]